MLSNEKKIMLKLKNTDPITRKTYNESDYYTHIRIVFEEKGYSNGVCYWNAYGSNRSFIEFSLSNPSGAVYDIAVPFSPVIHHQDTPIINSNIIETIGFPLFETYIQKYQDSYYHLPEDHIDFNIYASKTNTSLVFSSNTVILHVINDPIIFGFDQDNNLCYIYIQNMVLNEEGFLAKIN
jgi:hypothetical protein